MHPYDLTGKRFHRWLVIKETPRRGKGQALWQCKCDCGTIKEAVQLAHLTSGKSRSCGCLRREMWDARRKPDDQVHAARNPVYTIWQSMKTRCCNNKHPTFKYYGARGIGVCSEWLNDFDTFAADIGPRPSPAHTLERKDNNKGYTKDNCVWATQDEQNSNKRSNVKVDWKGQLLTITQIARMENVDYNDLRRMTETFQPLEPVVKLLQERGRTFYERAAAHGATGKNKTNQKRVRRLFKGKLIIDPLADIW